MECGSAGDAETPEISLVAADVRRLKTPKGNSSEFKPNLTGVNPGQPKKTYFDGAIRIDATQIGGRSERSRNREKSGFPV